MNWKHVVVLSILVLIVLNCSPSKEMVIDRSRTILSSEVTSIHADVTINVAWMPYEENMIISKGKNEYSVVSTGEEGVGFMPMLMVSHENGSDTLFLNMNIENELLGKLIKHSVMTQQPIERPFNTFFEEAKCESCHPSYIELPTK